MTEKEVRQLLKLMDKFEHVKTSTWTMDSLSMSIWRATEQWVRWYGRDELDMEIK